MIFLAVIIITVGGFFVWQGIKQPVPTPVAVTTPIPTAVPSPTPLPRTVTISTPAANATLVLGKTATVSGQATGLFEGNVVVRLTDSKGKVVVEKPITAENWMRPVPIDWSTQIAIPATAAAGLAQLTATNPSAEDAALDVSSTISVELSKTAPKTTATITGSWILTNVANAKGTLTAMPASISATMVLTDKQVSGKSACNNYSGSYTVSGTNIITFDPMISTKMACPPPQTLLETAQLQSFSNTTSYSLVGGVLTYFNPAKQPVAVYKRG